MNDLIEMIATRYPDAAREIVETLADIRVAYIEDGVVSTEQSTVVSGLSVRFPCDGVILAHAYPQDLRSVRVCEKRRQVEEMNRKDRDVDAAFGTFISNERLRGKVFQLVAAECEAYDVSNPYKIPRGSKVRAAVSDLDQADLRVQMSLQNHTGRRGRKTIIYIGRSGTRIRP